MEVKEEVVKHVDFKSSHRLRQTARAERNLVDSRKFEFSVAEVEQDEYKDGSVNVKEKGKLLDDCITLKKRKKDGRFETFVAHILKVGSIDVVAIDCQDRIVKEIMKTTESVQIKDYIFFIPGSSIRSNYSYLGFRADHYVRLCKTRGIQFDEFHCNKCVGRKEFAEIFTMVTRKTSLPERTIFFRVKSNEVIVELPEPGGLLSRLFRWIFQLTFPAD